ncbi:MAG: helix-turn-helix transcriptional regulator [Firmicutes bacterium]|nr:helix-turn-helix transcriptional regulator [Bacillota bacterium]MBR6500242.1 helix-turn-helix transcriptional regulator [Bacillota bacterium]
MKDISKRIKELRLEKEMTQDELAERLHVTRQAISKWETQKARPDLETIEALAQVFEITSVELLYGKKELQSSKKRRYLTAFLGIMVILGFWFDTVVIPETLWIAQSQYITYWYGYASMVERILFGCTVPCILSAISLKKEISIADRKLRRTLLIVGCLLTFIIIFFWIYYYTDINVWFHWINFHNPIIQLLLNIETGFGRSKVWNMIAGALIYLGLNKPRSPVTEIES